MSDIDGFIEEIETISKSQFQKIEKTALCNQEKVLRAFQDNKVALRHFSPTNGYGYDDIGRDTLNKVFAAAFECEDALVSPLIVSGTHALTLALFGLLRPGELILSVTDMPYDTLEQVISGNGIGSLKDFGIDFRAVNLIDTDIDTEALRRTTNNREPKIVYVQRSRGYNWRKALTIHELEQLIARLKTVYPKSIVVVDNCYGEFVETIEPAAAGADVIVGSLIKNPGGGLAPTGGYIAGKKVFVEQVAGRLTSPGIGAEVGSYAAGYRPFYQGLFLAPHTVAQALKTAVLFSNAFNKLGYETLPSTETEIGDIICSIKFNTAEALIAYCQTIQKVSPIDSFAVPEPWDMPGYEDPVIMAAGTFVQGASIELSADSPIREPYIAYTQGGLTYEHGKIALTECLKALKFFS